MKNVFVIGMKPFLKAMLESVEGARDYRFHELLSFEEAVEPPDLKIDLDALVDTAERRLDAFGGSIDAIIGYWDFPTSAIVPILKKSRGIPGPSLESVAACEHKYWARVEQKASIPEITPHFCALDPFADDPLAQVDLDYPYWVKPIKSHSGYLGFKVEGPDDLKQALPDIREGIGELGRPFDQFLARVDLPAGLRGIGGHHMIAEGIISGGKQCTLEGYVHGGEPVVYGVIDTVAEGPSEASLSRYQYPSRLPQSVQQRMVNCTDRLMRHIGYDNAPFNVEFYWHEGRDELRLLEVNTRISKSHCPLFRLVDGASHQQIAIELALGQKPDMPHRDGPHKMAGKFMLRVADDGLLTRVPQDAEIKDVQARFPEAHIHILVEEGKTLSEQLNFQESYSYEVGELFLGASSEEDLARAYQDAKDRLPFEHEPGQGTR